MTLEVGSPPANEISYGSRLRPGFRVEPEILTWDLGVFRVSPRVHGRPFVVCVPAQDLPAWLTALDAGRLDQELGMRLATRPRRTLRRIPRRLAHETKKRPLRLGIEHEFTVTRAGAPVDFRQVLPSLAFDAPAADPVDPRARRFSWGVITADGAEAEIAIDAVPVSHGFVGRAVAATEHARVQLERRLPADLSLTGFSTHLSVSWRPRRADRQAQRWIRAFAVAQMLLIDDQGSPGLLVRPRPGRLELGGEYAQGGALASASLLAVGTVRALAERPHSVRALAVPLRMEPAVERYGWFISRHAMGPDLYREGRATILRRADGKTVTAGEHLRDVSVLVIDVLQGQVDVRDLEPLIAVADGEQLLPSERAVR